MTAMDLRNIQTTGNNCRDALPCTNMALKLRWCFYLLMEKPLGLYFQVQSPYYQVAQCHQKTPIHVSSRWQVKSGKANKGLTSTLPPATTRIHLPKPVWSNSKARFSFNQPNRKRWDVKLVDLKHLPHKTFLLWHLLEGWTNKATEAPFR